MTEEKRESPHYIPELDPDHRRFPKRGISEMVYVIYTLLPFSIGGTALGIRNGNQYLLYLGIASLIITVAALTLIILSKRKQDS